MSASVPEFGIIVFACGGCGAKRSYPFLNKKNLLIPDLVRMINPKCHCGLSIEIDKITREQGCGEEEVTG